MWGKINVAFSTLRLIARWDLLSVCVKFFKIVCVVLKCNRQILWMPSPRSDHDSSFEIFNRVYWNACNFEQLSSINHVHSVKYVVTCVVPAHYHVYHECASQKEKQLMLFSSLAQTIRRCVHHEMLLHVFVISMCRSRYISRLLILDVLHYLVWCIFLCLYHIDTFKWRVDCFKYLSTIMVLL